MCVTVFREEGFFATTIREQPRKAPPCIKLINIMQVIKYTFFKTAEFVINKLPLKNESVEHVIYIVPEIYTEVHFR